MSEQIEDVLARMQESFQNKFIAQHPSNPQKQSQSILESSKEIKLLANSVVSEEVYKQKLLNKNSDNSHQNNQIHEGQDKSISPYTPMHKMNDFLQDRWSEQGYYKKEVMEQAKNQAHAQEENEQEDQQQNCYSSLSNKLQTALIKIDSMKSKNEQVNKNDLYSRFQIYQQKRVKQLEQKKREVEMKKFYGVRDKPQINIKSKAMTIHHEPIYTRFQKILEQKKAKQQNLEALKKEKQEQVFQKFITQYHEHVKLPTNARNADDFYAEMMEWKDKKAKEAQEIGLKLKKKELEGVTFKPILNEKSKKMVQKQVRIPIHQRQIKPKINHEEEYSFKPKINKRKVAY